MILMSFEEKIFAVTADKDVYQLDLVDMKWNLLLENSITPNNGIIFKVDYYAVGRVV